MKTFLVRLSVVVAVALAVLALPGAMQLGAHAEPSATATKQVTLTPIVVVSPDEKGGYVTVTQYTQGAGDHPNQPAATKTDEKKPGSGVIAFLLTFLLGAMVGGALMRLLTRNRPSGDATPTGGRRAADTTVASTHTASGATAASVDDHDDDAPTGRVQA